MNGALRVVDRVRPEIGVAAALRLSACSSHSARQRRRDRRAVALHELRREVPGVVVDEQCHRILAQHRIRMPLAVLRDVDPRLKQPRAAAASTSRLTSRSAQPAGLKMRSVDAGNRASFLAGAPGTRDESSRRSWGTCPEDSARDTPRQNVHSNEQMNASPDSGGKSRSGSISQLGRSGHHGPLVMGQQPADAWTGGHLRYRTSRRRNSPPCSA